MKHCWRVCALLGSLTSVAACVQGDLYSGDPGSSAATGGSSGTSATCGVHCHPTVAAAAAAGSTSSTGTTSGSSSTGSSSGTTGATMLPTFDCANLTATQAGVACPSGMVELSGQVVTLGLSGTEMYVPAVTVGALGCSTPAATSDSDGGFFLCLPASTPISATFSGEGDVPATMAEVNASASQSLGDVLVISTFIDSAVLNMAAVTPPFDQDAGAIFAVVHSVSGMGACAPALDAGGVIVDGGPPDYSGWTFTVTNLDGSPGPGSLAYINGADVSSSTTSTGPGGVALIYNISENLTEVKITATPPATLGSQCNTENSSLGFTGNVYALPFQFGYYPVIIP